jgi:MFS superfamily sulfate permease-like transporter
VPDPDAVELPAATIDVEPGLVVYRFGAALFYANTNQLSQEIRALFERPEGAPAWLVIDFAAVADVDFSGGETLFDLVKEARAAGSHLAVVQLDDEVRTELGRYGFLAELGDDAVFDTVEDAVEAYVGRSPKPPAPQATP